MRSRMPPALRDLNGVADAEENDACAQSDAAGDRCRLAQHHHRMGHTVLMEETVDDPQRIKAELLRAGAIGEEGFCRWRSLTEVCRNDESQARRYHPWFAIPR